MNTNLVIRACIDIVYVYSRATDVSTSSVFPDDAMQVRMEIVIYEDENDTLR